MNATEEVDLVGACQRHCGNRLGWNLAVDWWSARDHPGYPRDLGGQDAHVCRGDHWIPTAGHIATNVAYRKMLVPKKDSWKCLDLDVAKRCSLHFSEVPDLALRELDIGNRRGIDRRDDLVELARRQAKGVWSPIIELYRELSDGFFAAFGDVSNDSAHRGGEFEVISVSTLYPGIFQNLHD